MTKLEFLAKDAEIISSACGIRYNEFYLYITSGDNAVSIYVHGRNRIRSKHYKRTAKIKEKIISACKKMMQEIRSETKCLKSRS